MADLRWFSIIERSTMVWIVVAEGAPAAAAAGETHSITLGNVRHAARATPRAKRCRERCIVVTLRRPKFRRPQSPACLFGDRDATPQQCFCDDVFFGRPAPAHLAGQTPGTLNRRIDHEFLRQRRPSSRSARNVPAGTLTRFLRSHDAASEGEAKRPFSFVIGTRCATGLPRRTISIVSPLATASSNSDNRFWASYVVKLRMAKHKAN